MRPDAGNAQAPPPPAPHDGPVLLIGTADGAGDRLADLLGRHPRLCRAPRSRLLVDLSTAVERNLPALAAYGLPELYWRRATGAFFDSLQGAYATRNHKPRWVAYASSSSLTLHELWNLFPAAQFVHVITKPRGGAGRIVAANRRTGAGLPAGRYLEIVEGELLVDAEACARRVLHFLGEAIPEPVLGIESDREDDVVLEPEVVVDLADRRLPHPEAH
jgi:hypothetical protein